jgi:oxygen-independent coproporphyrinogen-3 oxidase
MLREALHAADQPAADQPAPNKPATVRPEPGYVLRSNTTDDLGAYLAGPQPVETAWLSPASQHEEAWFLGLRKNAGVNLAALRREFGRKMVAPAMEVVGRMADRGLLTSDGKTVRLTAQGQLLSNDVFQEFLGLLPSVGLT